MVTFLDAIKTKEEEEIINNCSFGEKLDNTLDEILFAETKFRVLDCLK